MKRLILFALVAVIPLACSQQDSQSTVEHRAPPKRKGDITNMEWIAGPAAEEPANFQPVVVKVAPKNTAPAADPEKPAPPKIETKGDWAQLFNGTDLNGWKPHPTAPGTWTVKDGVLIGNSTKDGYLFSERGDYVNFHLKMEAKIGDKAESGLFFRADQDFKKAPSGFKAQINSSGPGRNKTGTLVGAAGGKSTVTEQLVKPNTWYTHEVIADGKKIRILIDGKQTVDYTVTTAKYNKGYLALESKGSASADAKGKKGGAKGGKGAKGGGTNGEEQIIYIRKLEIKELPASGKQP